MKSLKLRLIQEEQSNQQETTNTLLKGKDTLKQKDYKEEINLPLQVELVCERCGKTYYKKRYEYLKGLRKGYLHNYCSRKCSCNTNSQKQKKRKCIVCGGEVEIHQKYCSKECKQMGMTKYRTLQVIVCPVCQKEFRPKSHLTKYCSMKCKNKAHSVKMKREGNSNYKDGKCYPIEFEQIKERIKKRDNYQCQMCGIKEKQIMNKRYGTISNLLIHHKDENKQNNEMSNLITLCKPCHTKLHKTKK